MKVSGCSIVKNAIRYDFPVVEAVRSILPLCDEFIMNVGKSQDETLELFNGLPGVNVFESEWDENLRERGELLSIETNKAISRCRGDWIFYIQADEVLHEKVISSVKNAITKYNSEKDVEGLLFDYVHFYGTYNVYQKSLAWYPHEVRIIRGNSGISSHGDAKGFRLNGRKLRVKHSGGIIHHYGWVRNPEKMLEKKKEFYRLWHQDGYIQKVFKGKDKYDFWEDLATLGVFRENHPSVMKERIERSGLCGYPKQLEKKTPLRECKLSFVNFLYKVGLRGSKNYKLL